MIRLRAKGSYDKTEKFLKKCKDVNKLKAIMEKYGREGIAALSADTPIDSGITSSSWNYEVVQEGDSISLVFNN